MDRDDVTDIAACVRPWNAPRKAIIAGRPRRDLREFDRTLDGLGAAVGPEDLIEPIGQRLSQRGRGLQHRLMHEDILLGMDDLRRLLLDRRHDARVAMTSVGYGDSGGEIGLPVAIDIPDVNALTMVDRHRRIPSDHSWNQLSWVKYCFNHQNPP